MPMDEKYFSWLYEQVRPDDKKTLIPYMTVSALAHRIIFDWSVPNDDNRAAEGKELRYEFLESRGVPRPHDAEWMSLDASIFEMMVALAKECDFIVALGFDGWYDIFMKNLGLDLYNDITYVPRDEPKVARILEKFNQRRYTRLGVGGLFPLRSSAKDQREVELWYQMAEYMTENRMY
jgi:hypothetical protein